jgi:acyl-CoA thioester hydrolase
MDSEFFADFPVMISLPVQWGDQDAFGHVNNTVYFRWFESARIAYLDRPELRAALPDTSLGPILAAIRCDFRHQVTFPDIVQIGARVTRVGRSSFVMEHRAVSDTHKVVVAEGDSTIVVFDYTANRSHPMPAEMRQALEVIEHRSFTA